MIIPKYKYMHYCQCPKMVWIEKYKKELLEKTTSNNTFYYNPINDIDKFSKKLFNSEDACIYTNENKERYNLQLMVEQTKKLLLSKNCNSIYKATFEYDNTYFTIDILRKVKSGYIAYLLKPYKNLRQNFILEMSYIAYILQKLNIPVYRYCIITINHDFKKEGEIDPKKYFKINYVGQKIKKFLSEVETNLDGYKKIIENPNEPYIEYGTQCSPSHPCPYTEYCRKPLPTPSVFDLYQFNKKMDFYQKNILSFDDIVNSGIELNSFQKRQINYYKNSLPTYVEKENLKTYLKNFTYPLYFLDFETTQQELPLFDGITPFEQIPFQYSLHYIENEGGELKHTEFLANENSSPKPALVKQLVSDIPENSCIVAYNAQFEKRVISQLAKVFPEYSDHLISLTKNFVDLIDPFEKGYVYDKLMGGSFSLKSVLPALYPNDPSMNYSNLEDVHNGKDARLLFPTLKYLSKEEREKERNNLLKYCYLDTFAMVKIWEKLKTFVE